MRWCSESRSKFQKPDFGLSKAGAIDEQVRIVPIRQEQLKDRLGDRFRELDVPLLVEWPTGEKEAKTMTSFSERFIQKGFEQGAQQGEASLLLRLMERKFGVLPDNYRKRIQNGDLESLNKLVRPSF